MGQLYHNFPSYVQADLTVVVARVLAQIRMIVECLSWISD